VCDVADVSCTRVVDVRQLLFSGFSATVDRVRAGNQV
jgi:hypothetical protein